MQQKQFPFTATLTRGKSTCAQWPLPAVMISNRLYNNSHTAHSEALARRVLCKVRTRSARISSYEPEKDTAHVHKSGGFCMWDLRHTRVDHGRAVGEHRAPEVALDVDEAQQLRVADVLARDRARVGWQVGRQRQACERVLGELCARAPVADADSCASCMPPLPVAAATDGLDWVGAVPILHANI